MIFGRVSASDRIAPVQWCSPASACGTSPSAAARRAAAAYCARSESATRRAPPSGALGEIQRHDRNVFLVDVVPDVQFGPVRQRKYADALALIQPAVVQVPQLRPLILGVPLPERVAETNRRAPWRATSLRRAALRRMPRRSPPACSASSSARVFSRPQHFCVPSRNGLAPSSIACLIGVDDQLDARSPRRTGRETRSSRETCRWCRRAAAGNGIGPGWNAFCASRTITEESLPIEYSITGRSNSAATSRRCECFRLRGRANGSGSVQAWERIFTDFRL